MMGPSKVTTPQERWGRKNGYISKSYKMYQRDVDRFAEACKKSGVSQAEQLRKMMRDFSDEVLKK